MIRIQGACSVNHQSLFSGLDLTLAKGKWTCLLGSSGVGKSTLLRLLAGLPTGAEFSGVITGAPEHVAYMAQQDLLMPWLNVQENVLLGPRLRGEPGHLERAQALLEQVGLGGFEQRPVSQLSGGQRQRVALARTLMEDRELVLLDEPFGALDARTRSQMQELTADCLYGRTVLLVTHDPAEAARMGESIYLMTAQGVESIPAMQGPPPQAFDKPELLKLQTQLLHRLRGDTLKGSVN